MPNGIEESEEGTKSCRHDKPSSALTKIGEYGGRSGNTRGNSGAASNHLLISGITDAAMAVGGARRQDGAAQGIKPTMDRTKTCSHGLGSFQSSSQDTHYILQCSIDSAMHAIGVLLCNICMATFISR